MGGPTFDRQVFVKKQQKQPPPSRSPLPGALVLLIVAALASFATYRYVKAGGGAPSNPADQAQIKQLQKKLKAMQARVKELENRRRARPAKHVAADDNPKDAKPAATKPTHTLLPESATHVNGHATADAPGAVHRTASHEQPSNASTSASGKPRKASPAPAKQTATQSQSPSASKQSKSDQQLSMLQRNLAASHDEWQATTNRLGSVVGQLDSQQTAIQKNQNNVNYLLERVHRSDVPFTLQKGHGLQRVGPISMKLASTSVRNQRYSVRMIVDDKSVELKDRALNEVVEFYTSESQYPLRLIVSKIGKHKVSGTLAIPSSLSRTAKNPQLQKR